MISYPDIHYETHYQTRKKPHYVRLDYKNGLRLTEEEQIPPDNHAKRPEVPMEIEKRRRRPVKRHAENAAGSCGRQRKQRKNSIPFNVYDGNRLTEADFTVEGKTTLRYGDKTLPVIKVGLVRRKQLAGFTPKELDDFDPNEPPLYVYFSDDARLLPIRVETTFY